FEVVSLETLETQSLLDQADTSLDFVARKESVKPIHIERLNGEFLLNYSEFSFFVNRNGWRARPEWRIDWEGAPHSFALSYPWILAFEANFIELRNIENGAVHIVPHKNIRMLHSSTHEIGLDEDTIGAEVEDEFLVGVSVYKLVIKVGIEGRVDAEVALGGASLEDDGKGVVPDLVVAGSLLGAFLGKALRADKLGIGEGRLPFGEEDVVLNVRGDNVGDSRAEGGDLGADVVGQGDGGEDGEGTSG
ncbi:hypothetical protein BN1708_017873, partial [Verticillium longisporum]